MKSFGVQSKVKRAAPADRGLPHRRHARLDGAGPLHHQRRAGRVPRRHAGQRQAADSAGAQDPRHHEVAAAPRSAPRKRPRRPHLNRIVCLVPSITELVCELGLADQLVGRTGFCIHPKDALKTIPKVGGTKSVNLKKIRALAPTHVIVNVDENRKETADALAAVRAERDRHASARAARQPRALSPDRHSLRQAARSGGALCADSSLLSGQSRSRNSRKEKFST